jgi:CRP-like cAMP-binding protein
MHHILEEIPLFDGVKPSVLKSNLDHLTIKKYKRNQLIIHENERNTNFYILLKGEVKVFRRNKYRQEIILTLLQEGDFFGELSILEDHTASANVATIKPTQVLCIKDRQFMKLLKTVPRFSERLFYYMSHRIRSCDESIECLKRANSLERIGAVLVQIAEKSGVRKKTSVIIDKLPFQNNIASLAGTSRETVSRAFSRLEENEYISKSGRYLVINDYPRFYEEFSR